MNSLPPSRMKYATSTAAQVLCVLSLAATIGHAQSRSIRISDGLGVTEWEEWSFADIEFWQNTNLDQRREEFGASSGAAGTIVVADPDEWDDTGGSPAGNGVFNTQIFSPLIDVGAADPASLSLEFASSWRPFDQQTATVDVFYDGVPQRVVRFSSNPIDADFKDDESTDELLSFALPDATGVSSIQFAFALFNAGNDWWWAFDNVRVSDNVGDVFFEDFESVELGPAIDEIDAAGDRTDVFSQFGPDGWLVNTDNFVPDEALKTPPGVRHVTQITREILPRDPQFKLQVDPSTGEAQFVSVVEENVVLTGYSIESESGSLDSASWSASNLGTRGVDRLSGEPGESWQTVLVDDTQVFEASLLSPTEIGPGETLKLGVLFDTDASAVQDLHVAFSFTEVDPFGNTLSGSTEGFFPVIIEYVEIDQLAGDYNGDGQVDAADFTIWRDNEAAAARLLNETASPGVVDAADYDAWVASFGAAAASSVPEPTALLLIATLSAASLRGRRGGAPAGGAPIGRSSPGTSR